MAYQQRDGPPWQHSGALGGDYVYNPRTDMITMRNGRQFQRPPNVSAGVLASATYEGPLPVLSTQAQTPRTIPVQQQGGPASLGRGRGGPQLTTAQTGNAYHHGQQTFQQRPRPTAAYPTQAPALPGASRSQSVAQGVRRMSLRSQALPDPNQLPPNISGTGVVTAFDPWTQVRTVVQKSSPEVITSPDLLAQGIVAHERLMNTQSGDYEKLAPSFRIRNASFFTVGRVFKVLWAEPAGGTATAVTRGIVEGELGEHVYCKVRGFVVIREGEHHCSALPITTYGGRGVAKFGVTKSDHGIIYTGKEIPAPDKAELQTRPNERGIRPLAIRVDPDSPLDRLDPKSRINYAAVHTVQHNIKVKSSGTVNIDSRKTLLQQFQNVWNSPRGSSLKLPTQARQSTVKNTGVVAGASGSLQIAGFNVAKAGVGGFAAGTESKRRQVEVESDDEDNEEEDGSDAASDDDDDDDDDDDVDEEEDDDDSDDEDESDED